MNNLKIVVVSHCETKYIDNFGGFKLRNSLSYFHPEIPFIHCNENDLKKIYQDNLGVNLWATMPYTMLLAWEKYPDSNIVCHLDWDSLVLGKLNSLIEEDYDVAGVTSDGPHVGNRDERRNRPILIENLPNELYLNCGLVSVTNRNFLHDWIQVNNNVIKEYGDIRTVPLGEQGTFNALVYATNKYKLKQLDPWDGKFYYGASANRPTKGIYCPEHIKKEYNVNNWESWYDIQNIDGKFYLDNKEIKILHASGGGNPASCKKLSFDLFNPVLLSKLTEISGYVE